MTSCHRPTAPHLLPSPQHPPPCRRCCQQRCGSAWRHSRLQTAVYRRRCHLYTAGMLSGPDVESSQQGSADSITCEAALSRFAQRQQRHQRAVMHVEIVHLHLLPSDRPARSCQLLNQLWTWQSSPPYVQRTWPAARPAVKFHSLSTDSCSRQLLPHTLRTL